jgi:hypothetical protein
MGKTKILLILLVAPLILGSCVEVTGVELGDCTFYVDPDSDLCLTYEVILACSGKLTVNIVEDAS